MNRLPPEIFSEIIQHVPHELAVDAWSIIRLTHVCRHWREIIISTPGNWTLVSSSNKRLMVLGLERAKTSPLKLRLWMDDIRETPGFLDLITPYIWNTESLQIGGISSVPELSRTLPNISHSTPNLKSLRLSGVTARTRHQVVDPFGLFAPTLRYLSLVSFPLYPSLLRLESLTELALYNSQFDLHLDTLLDFLKENRSLESAILSIRFATASLRSSRRRSPIKNRLQYLFIEYSDAMDGKALVSNIALRSGAQLELCCRGRTTGLDELLSSVPTTQFSNLPSPTSIDYGSRPRVIRLLGPNGSFSFGMPADIQAAFVEFPFLPLVNIRKFHLIYTTRSSAHIPGPVFDLSSFPALETFTVDCDSWVSQLLSALVSNPTSLPSLKTLGFLNSVTSPNSMEALTQFASKRKNTTSTPLERVVIVNILRRCLPSGLSIKALRKHVPTVDVSVGRELPADLVWKGSGRYTNLPICSRWHGRV